MIPEEWSSLETTKLVVDLLLPIVLLGLGFLIFFLERRIEEKIDQGKFGRNWRKDLYEAMARDLNVIYCVFNYVGDWREYSPVEIIRSKRELDFRMHAYSGLFSEGTLLAYEELMNACFETGRGRGSTLQIRANVNMFKESLRVWKEEFEQQFVDEGQRLKRKDFAELYSKYKGKLFSDLGLQTERN